MRRKHRSSIGWLILLLLFLSPLPAQAQWAIPRRPKVHPILIKREKISTEELHLPEAARLRYRGAHVVGSYSVCIGSNGLVTSVEPHFGIRGADEAIMRKLETWRFRPRPFSSCYIQETYFWNGASFATPAPETQLHALLREAPQRRTAVGARAAGRHDGDPEEEAAPLLLGPVHCDRKGRSAARSADEREDSVAVMRLRLSAAR